LKKLGSKNSRFKIEGDEDKTSVHLKTITKKLNNADVISFVLVNDKLKIVID
jgi:hypothetical protein